MIKIGVDFTGGLETLFDNQRHIDLELDQKSPSFTIRDLIDHLKENFMDKSKENMFLQDGTVRPGILVLINDADWELEGEEDYEIQNRDNIMFASTLHGG